MPNPRLMAVVTVLLLVAGPQAGQARYTLAQLQVIEQFILARDCAGLEAYLIQNREILEGDDPLAVELRNFMAGVSSGLIQCLSVSPQDDARNGAGPVDGAY